MESTRAWRLSSVLGEVRYPAQKWAILTVADLYGADVQTQIELRNLPELTYHDIDEVVAAVETSIGERPTETEPSIADCCEWRA